VDTTTSRELETPDIVLEAEEITRIQNLVKKVPVSEKVLKYAVRLVRASRNEDVPEVSRYLAWGAGPRAGQACDIEDIRSVAYPVLRHRFVTNFRAEADGISTDDLIGRLLEAVEA